MKENQTLQKIMEEAEKRWNNGGKEMYERIQENPELVNSIEFKNYLNDNGITQGNIDSNTELLFQKLGVEISERDGEQMNAIRRDIRKLLI